MYREIFLRDMSELGRRVSAELNDSSYNSLLVSSIREAKMENPFFNEEMQKFALNSIAKALLNKEVLYTWISQYENEIKQRELVVGVIMPGNIPAVGFHDLISVLAAGFKCEVKLSKRDSVLIPAIVKILFDINDLWREKILFSSTLSENIIALIAAGSDSTIKILGMNYNGIPSLFRGTRTSVAIINGKESNMELDDICDDIFLYFGMGCRSVTRLFVPKEYNMSHLLESSQRYSMLSENEDYLSSYKYQRAMMKMAGEIFIDGGFFLLSTNELLPPPLSVVGLEYYSDYSEIERFIDINRSKIQAIEGVGRSNFILPGKSQMPGPSDYADGLDTVRFLLDLTENNSLSL